MAHPERLARVPGSRSLEPDAEIGELAVAHLAEEGERHVPALAAGPPEPRPGIAQRRDGLLKFVKRRERRVERHEQSHGPLLSQNGLAPGELQPGLPEIAAHRHAAVTSDQHANEDGREDRDHAA